ncbi:Bys1 family protein [Lasiosphaeris hirsuta]|uniref:Bys1 family protein n=1 Tax=Lasiosphaeris hirsuta TaxID=260670 RepID=A0AA40AQJ7_9PEZI|nr:Bys1 family protein [Lasiosphaeris hirsuta]
MLNNAIFALAVAAPLVSAIGNARVVNKCSTAVTLWSVGQAVSGPFTLAANGGSYAEQFVRDPVTGGKALKITKAPDGLYTGAPELIYAYSLDGDKVWYDLSTVFGDVFPGKKIVEASAEASCPTIEWPNGTPPAGSQVKTCTAQKDVTLTLCA